MKKRLVCWFSCGAASAVATKLAILENQKRRLADDVLIAYIKIKEEHNDNKRFLRDCERWFDAPIVVLTNEKYGGSIVNVFNRLNFMGGISGAPCTLHLKKEIRRKIQRPDDLQVLGYTVEEMSRADRFIDANAEADLWPILIEKGLTKNDCLAIIQNAGIAPPIMYKLGYRNNNCIGCVKGGAGYWNKIRVDFPEVFKQRCEQSRAIGARLVRDSNGNRIFLDELAPDAGKYPEEPDFQCGFMCEIVSKENNL